MGTGTRVMHEMKRRRLTVREVRHVTPAMLRIVFASDDLADFVSLAPDDHVKLIFPVGADGVERRDYTPRYFDRAARTLAVDFALHDDGVATSWARAARPGESIEMLGPKGSLVIPWDFDWWLLVGDEAALPAIGRRIEEAPAGTRILAVVAVASPEDEQAFRTEAAVGIRWVHRQLRDVALCDPVMAALPIIDALDGMDFPSGRGFVWIATEGRTAKVVRNYVLTVRGHPREWVKASGYWVSGKADAHVKFEA